MTLLLCAVVSSWADTETLSGADATSAKDTEIKKTSFTMLSTYNPSGSRSVNSKSTLKVRFNQTNEATGNAKGFALKVNDGYTITGLTMQVSGNGKVGTLDKVDIDGTDYTGTIVTELKKNDEYSTLTLSGISAENYINFVAASTSEATQLYVYITVTYEAPQLEEPTATTVTPASAYVAVGKTTTLTGSFTGGTFEGEWVSDNEAVATVSSTGVVTGVSEGTANITYQWTEDQSEDAYKATAVVTVVEAFDKNGLEAVKTYDFANWGATTLAISSTAEGKIYNAANSVNNDVFRCTNEGLTSIAIQAVLSSNKGWSINDDGLNEGSGAGRCAAVCDVEAGQYIEFYHNSETSFYTRNNGEDDGAKKIPLVEEKGHHVYKVIEDGMVGFELAKGHYVTSIVIYEKKTGTATSLEFSSATANATLGEDFTEPTLTKTPSDLAGVVFSSSNTAVATVDAETGEVTLKAGGITTITATFTETAEYWGAEASYVLTVTDPSVTGYTDEAATITWAFNTGATGQTANIVYGTAEEELFKSNNVSIGANLEYAGTQSLNGDNTGLTSTKIKQNNAGSATEQKNAIKFTITPKTGITFTPTSVRFLATRCGTDGGKMEIAWIDTENSTVALGSAAASKTSDDPARDNNATNNATLYSYNLTAKGAKATTGECGLQIITYSANGKSYAFGQIIIEGTLSGSVSAVTTYTITAQVGTDGAGSVNPTEVVVDEGEGTSIEAIANTGYVFQNWTKASDTSWSSTDNPLTITNVTADEAYTANYKKLFAVNYDTTSDAELLVGTCKTVLGTEYANLNDKFTAPKNLYTAKNGYHFTNWTDGANSYLPNQEYTLTSDITLTPVFASDTQSLTSERVSDLTVTWNFSNNYVFFNSQGNTQYYVQQATINDEAIDVVMFCDQTNGKLNNVGRSDALVQANGGTVLTIPATRGMQVQIPNVHRAFKTEGQTATTIAGSEDYTLSSDGKTATYTYTGTDETISIAIGGDIQYITTVVVTYPKNIVKKSISAAGYATFCTNVPVNFGEDVEAYIATVAGDKVSFTKVTNIPANTGVLLKGSEGEKTFTVAASTTDVTANKFVGVLTDTEVAADNFVLMGSGDYGVGFYSTPETFTVGANTAYLPASVASGRSFIWFESETTGIQAPVVKNLNAGEIYTIAGQRVAKPTKGLYIMNGKKVVVK